LQSARRLSGKSDRSGRQPLGAGCAITELERGDGGGWLLGVGVGARPCGGGVLT
jgi:hypothetical protein